MKLLFIFFLNFVVSHSFATNCKVFGISDSPQKLKCRFKTFDLNLSCHRGHYFVNNDRVVRAYHLDVEDGAVPLVFDTSHSKLTIMMNSKVDIKALLKMKNRIYSGTCL
jgi:hypothetical protein